MASRLSVVSELSEVLDYPVRRVRLDGSFVSSVRRPPTAGFHHHELI